MKAQERGGAVFVSRQLLGCAGLLLIPLLWLAGWTIVDNLDTSEGGASDPVLAARVAMALGCEVHMAEFDDSFQQEDWWEASRPLTDAHVAAQVRQVDGWDQIALIAPRETGEALVDDPALTSWWLRRRLAGMHGEFGDCWYRVLVIRDQAVAADFSFKHAQGALHSMLVSRLPPTVAPRRSMLPYVVGAAAFIVLLVLVRRAGRASGWKGAALGCLLAASALLVALILLLELTDGPREWLSGQGSADGPAAPEDLELAGALRRALLGMPSEAGTDLPADPDQGKLEVRLDTPDEFSERLRSVPGWDLIVILGPSGDGEEASRDPRITSARLSRRIAPAQLFMADIFDAQLLVVRGEDIVARPIIRLLIDRMARPPSVLSAHASTGAALPGDAPADTGLVEQLERAVSGVGEAPLRRSDIPSRSRAVVVDGPLSLAEFRARASRVAGWDQLAIVGPFDTGRQIARDPALKSLALVNAARRAHSWSEEGLLEVIVVRADRVVGTLTLEAAGADFWSCVVERLAPALDRPVDGSDGREPRR